MQPFILLFLLFFLKKGRLPLGSLPLYQVVESFHPAMARAYKLAKANIAYRRFSFFFNPRYTVFLWSNGHLMIRNTCPTLQRICGFPCSVDGVVADLGRTAQCCFIWHGIYHKVDTREFPHGITIVNSILGGWVPRSEADTSAAFSQSPWADGHASPRGSRA